MKYVELYVGHSYKPFWTKRNWPGWQGGSGKIKIGQNIDQNGPHFWLWSPLKAPKWVKDPWKEFKSTRHPSSISLSNVSFCVPILGTKNGTCLSDGPALRGFQKRKLAYSFERISCSSHLKSESAVVRVHWCDPGLRGWSVGWSPQNHPGWL